MEQKAASHSPSATSPSAVESIVNALSQLESDIDGLGSRVEEMKKRMIAHSNQEIENLKQQVIAIGTEEAKRILDKAKAEADAESSSIIKEADAGLAVTKKNIESSFDKAIESIVKAVLEEGSSGGQSHNQKAKAESPQKSSSEQKDAAPKRIKKYTSDGKPA